jgi:hypothetical protein
VPASNPTRSLNQKTAPVGILNDSETGNRSRGRKSQWEALLGESRSWRTNATRTIRHTAYQVARKRVQTVLNRFVPKDAVGLSGEIALMIDRAGL